MTWTSLVDIESSEEMIPIPGDTRWPQTVKQEGDMARKTSDVLYGRNVLNALLSEVSLLGVRVVLRLNGLRGQWSNDRGKQKMSMLPPTRAMPSLSVNP